MAAETASSASYQQQSTTFPGGVSRSASVYSVAHTIGDGGGVAQAGSNGAKFYQGFNGWDAAPAAKAQSIAFTPLPAVEFTTSLIALTAVASSGLPVSFAVVSGPAVLSGNALSLTGVGTVTVVASQNGNPNFLVATPVTNTFTVGRASQTINFAAVPNTTYSINGTAALSAAASSGLAVSYSVAGGPATLAGNTVSLTGAGTVTVVASQSGNANYLAATSVTNTFTVGKAGQTISFAAVPNTTYTTSGTVALNAAASSGLAVSYSVASGPATVSGGTVSLTGAGTVSVVASQSGNANYLMATPVTNTFTVGKASQTINFTAIPNTSYSTNGTMVLSATASSALAVSYSVASGPATISGSTVSLTGAGTVSVVASQSGNADYVAATSVTNTFTVGKASQTINFTAIPNTTYSTNGAVVLNATASSALAVSYSVASGPATVSGSTLNLNGVGTVSVIANQSGNSNYLAATSVTNTFTVGPASQTISFTAIPNTTYSTNGTVTLSATASSGLTVSYGVTSGPATISGGTVSLTGAGTVSVVANQSGNANYLAATSVTNTFTVGKASQTISFAAVSNTTYTTNGTVVLSAGASSGLAVTYSVASGPATISGGTVSLTGAGTVSVVASQNGNANYLAATSVTNTFTVGKASQTISFAAVSNTTYTTNGTVVLSAGASSGLAVTYSVASGPATISGGTVSLTGAGTVSVVASQNGNANYLAATSVTNTFTVGKASQTINFAAIPNTTYSTNGTVVLSATASSALAVTYSVASGPATVSGNTLSLTSAGTVSVVASQSGNANYLAATPVTNTFTVGQASQTISFTAIPNTTYSTNGTVALSATASSGLAVGYGVASGPATVSGNTVNLTGAGTVSVVASQSGNANYLAATSVTNTFTVGKASQTINFTAIPNTTYSTNGTVALSATASSALAVSYSVASGPATVSGGTVSLTGAGTVSVVANQSGNANYLAATSVTNTFTVGKAGQTISFTAIPNTTYSTNGTVALSAVASSGLAVSYSVVAGPATISGSTISLTGAGTVSLVASQNGSANYLAATSVTNTFAVGQASQTISFTAIPNTTYSTNGTVALIATASSGLAVSYSVASGPATVSGNVVSLTAAGTVSVVANQSGNTNYLAATPVTNSFTVGQASQTISFTAIPNTTYSTNGTVALSAVASSGLAVSYSVVAGPATISGSTVSLTGAGTVSLVASQNGNANYLAATSVTNTFAVGQASQTISFTAIPGTTYSTNGTVVLSATTSSGLAVSYSVASGPATLSGSTVSLTGAGTVSVVASQSGNTNYLAATSVTNTFTVGQASQTISFTVIPNTTYSTNGTVALSATASSGLVVSYNVASGPATISGSTVSLTGVGTVSVVASQSGNTNYLVATPVTNTFTVGQASQTISFTAIPNTTYSTNGTVTLSATASSGLAVSYSVASGSATISGSTASLTGAGTVSVVASQSGNTNYLAATPVTNTFTVGQASQTISFAAIPNTTYSTNGTVVLSATASSGLAVSYSVVSGPATTLGSTVSLTGTGTVSVVASQSGNTNYLAATPVTNTFAVGQASQTINFAAIPNTTYSTNGTVALSATASSSLAVSYSVASGPATISGGIVSLTGAGTVSVVASQSGNTNYLAATPVTNTFAVGQSSQIISFAAIPNTTYSTNGIVTLSATASSGLAVSYSVASGPATILGNTVSLTGAGAVSVVASQSGNTNYLAATPVTNTFTVGQAGQTISFTAIPNTTYSTNGTVTLSATASSGLAVSYSVASGPATILGNTVSLTGAGSVSVVASQSGNTNYLAATSITNTFTVGQASQTISFAAIPNTTYSTNGIVTLSATASSGLAVSYSVASGPATILGNTVSLTGAGTVSVVASQSGNTNYLAATPVTNTFTVGQASQTISFAAIPNTTYSTNGTVALSATASSGLAVSYSVASGAATVSGNAVSLTGAGTVSVVASQSGNTNYLAATPVTNTFTVGQASQTISFAAIPNTTYSTNGTVALSATASSGLVVSYSVASGPATISGNTVSLTGAGTVSVVASQSGNTNYLAATPVTNTFTVGQASQTISFAAIPNTTYSTNGTVALSATASSGLVVSYSVASGAATVSGNTVNLTGAGTVSVVASQSGNTNYLAATPVTNTFTVGQASQTISFAAIPNTTYSTNGTAALSAMASSGLAVSYSVASGAATVSGNTVNLTGAGTVSVVASQSGNTNYLAAAPVTNTFTVEQASQTISFAAIPNTTYSTNGTVALSATASSGLAVSYSVASGPATISGNTISLTGAGTVSVVASQSGNTNYLAATSVTNTFTVGRASQAISFVADTKTRYETNGAIVLSASSSSGLNVTLNLASGPATLSDGTLTFAGIGTAQVVATQSGDINYLPAVPVTNNFVAGQPLVTNSVTLLLGSARTDIEANGSVSFDFADPLPTGATIIGLGLASTYSTAWPAADTGTFATQIVSLDGAGIPALGWISYGTDSALAQTNLVYSGPVESYIYSGTNTLAIQSLDNPVTLGALSLTITHFTEGASPQSISFAPLADREYSTNAIELDATASSGLPVSWTVLSGPAFVEDNLLFLTGVGEIAVTADQAGSFNFLPADTVTNIFQVFPASQEITFTPISDIVYSTNAIVLVAAADSGLPVSFTILSGPAAVTGNLLSLTGTGTVVVQADQAGDSNHAAAAPVVETFVVGKRAQSIVFDSPPDIDYTTRTMVLDASASSGLAVFYTASDPDVASVSGSVLTVNGTGTVIITANQEGSDTYLAAEPVSHTLTVAKAPQSIVFQAISNTTLSATPISLVATASSGLLVSFTVLSGPATVTGHILTLTGAGTVVVQADQGGDSNYAAATAVVNTFVVGKKTQDITFGSLSDIDYSTRTVALDASASSGLPIYYTVSNTNIASVSGGILTVNGAGTVIVTAGQGGDAEYLAAEPVSQTLTVAKAPQSIVFQAISNTTLSATPISLVATASSGLLVSFTVLSGPATVTGHILTLTGAGTVVVQADQGGDSNYAAATAVVNTFVVSKKTQDITFGSLSDIDYSTRTVALDASASSGLPVYYTVSNTNIASVSGSLLTVNGAGTVIVTAGQGGDAEYLAAEPVSQTLTVAKAPQSIVFQAISNTTLSSAPISLDATASSGLLVSFTVLSGPATVAGHMLTLTGTGTVEVQADQQGNSNYVAATAVMNTFVVGKKTQDITFSSLSDIDYSTRTMGLDASASSGLPVYYTVSDTNIASVSGSALTVNGAGTVIVTAGQGGDAEYLAAEPVSQSLTVAKASQSITFATVADTSFSSAPVQLDVSASSSLPVTLSLTEGSATITGSTVNLTRAGRVVIVASQAGNSNYLAAVSVTNSFNVAKAAQTIAFDPIYTTPYTTNLNLSLHAVASSAGTVIYSVLEGNASVADSILTVLGPGMVTVRAEQAGDTRYSAVSATNRFLVTDQPLVNGVFRELWANLLASDSLDSLTNTVLNPRWPNEPDPEYTRIIPSFETDTDTGKGNYGQRVRAILSVPQTGDYLFWIASDDNSNLFLSTDDDPANVRLIADVAGWTGSRQWDDSPEQRSESVSLVAGRRYYIEATYKQGGGGDNLAVGWQLPDGTLERPILQSRLEVNGLDIIPFITSQPTNATVVLGDTAVFSVAALGNSLAYQWYADGIPLPDATNSSLVLGTSHTNDSAAIQVIVSNLQGSTASETVSLSVVLKSQTIDFTAIGGKVLGDAPFALVGAASSGLPVSYEIVSGPATVAGNVVTLTGTGTVVVRARQDGNDVYAAAEPVERNFDVSYIELAANGDSYQSTEGVHTQILASGEINHPLVFRSFTATATLRDQGVGGVDTENGVYAGIYANDVLVYRGVQLGTGRQSGATDSGFYTSTWTASASELEALNIVLSRLDWSGVSQVEIRLVAQTVGTPGSSLEVSSSAFAATAEPGETASRQSMQFDPIFTTVYQTNLSFNLHAVASSGMDVVYNVLGGDASVSNNILTIAGPGFVTVAASQSGNLHYFPVAMTNRFLVTDGPVIQGAFRELWANLSGELSVDSLTNVLLNPRWPNQPDQDHTRIYPELETDTNTGLGNYGQRVRSFLSVPQTGDYTFWIASDDNSALFVSTDEDPANVQLVAGVPSWTDSRQWNDFASQMSQPISLVAGKRYYVEALFKQGGGGDNLAVGWALPDGTLERPIPQNRLELNGLDVIPFILAQPTNMIVDAGHEAIFSVRALGNLPQYQWYTNGVPVAGATGAVLTLNPNGGADSVSLYVVVTNALGAVTSDTVSLTVNRLAQTISFASIPDTAYSTNLTSLSATSSSGLPVSFSVLSGPAATSGDSSQPSLVLNGAGMVVVVATQAGDANYLPAEPVTNTFAVSSLNQTISFASLPDTFYTAGAGLGLTASASSGLQVNFSILSGPASVNGNLLTLEGTGEVVVVAAQAGDAIYSAAVPVTNRFTIASAVSADTYTATLLSGTSDIDANQSLYLSFADSLPQGARVTGLELSLQYSTYWQPSDGLVSRNKVYLNGNEIVSLNWDASGTVGAPVSLDNTHSGGISGYNYGGQNTLRLLSLDNPTTVASVSLSITYATGPAHQTITFSTLPDRVYVPHDTAVLQAVASSGLPVTFNLVSGPAVLAGNQLTLMGVGTVVVAATQSGSSSFYAAPPVTNAFKIGFKPVASPSLLAYWDFNDSSNPFASSDKVSDRTGEFLGTTLYSADGGGQSGLTGDRAVDFGNTGESVGVGVDDVSFLNLAAAGDQVTVAFWEKLYVSDSSNVAIHGISPTSNGDRGFFAHVPWGDTLYFDSAGCCGPDMRISSQISLDWTQWHHFAFVKNHGLKQVYVDGQLLVEGSNDDAGAAPLPTDFTRLLIGAYEDLQLGVRGLMDDFAVWDVPLSQEEIGALSARTSTPSDLTNAGAGFFAQDISFPAVSATTYPTNSFVLAASASSGLPVSFSLANPADSQTNAVHPVSYSFSPGPGFGDATGTTLTDGQTGPNFFADESSKYVGWASDPTIQFDFGEEVTFRQVRIGFNVWGGTICVPLSVAIEGREYMLPEDAVDGSTGVGRGYVTFDGEWTGDTLEIAIKRRCEWVFIDEVQFLNPPVAMLTNNILTFGRAGSVPVVARQDGNTNYFAALPVTNSYTMDKMPAPVITFPSIADRDYTNSAISLGASADAGVEITYQVLGGPATVNGSSLTLTGAGQVTVVARFDGDGNHAPSTRVTNTFNVAVAQQSITFGSLPDLMYSTNVITLAGTSSFGLSLDYTVVSGPASVTGNAVTLLGEGVVTLRASQQGNSGVAAANPVTVSFKVYPSVMMHGVYREVWTGLGSGPDLDSLTNAAVNVRWPYQPDAGYATNFATFDVPSEGICCYGQRVRSFLRVPQAGDYTFWIASDDNSVLLLSDDENPANAQVIAYVSDWTDPGQWTGLEGQQSAAVHLVAGARYYVEAIHKQGSGGDNLAVAWQLPDGTFEGPIPESRLEVNGIETQPFVYDQSSDVSVDYGEVVYLSVSAIGENLLYQWYKDGVPVGGATQSVLKLDSVTFADAAEYYVTIENSHGLVTSQMAVVAVTKPVHGLMGEYFAGQTGTTNGTPDLVSYDPVINFDWGGGSPKPSLPNDNFTIRWTGYVKVPDDVSELTFYTGSDDGARLWVNGQLLVDQWHEQGPSTYSGALTLEPGKFYPIQMDYFEAGGGAMAILSWSSASFAFQPIPSSSLWVDLPGTNTNGNTGGGSGSGVITMANPPTGPSAGQGNGSVSIDDGGPRVSGLALNGRPQVQLGSVASGGPGAATRVVGPTYPPHSEISRANGVMTLTVRAEKGLPMTVYSSVDLREWIFFTQINGAGLETPVRVPVPMENTGPERRFFKIEGQ